MGNNHRTGHRGRAGRPSNADVSRRRTLQRRRKQARQRFFPNANNRNRVIASRAALAGLAVAATAIAASQR